MPVRCVILGGGGHARVLLDTLLENGDVEIRGILDRDGQRQGAEIYGIPILGGDEQLPRLMAAGVTHFVLGLGSAGNNEPRGRLFQESKARGLSPLSVVHRTSICSRRAHLGEGVQLLAGSIINASARLGDNVIVNTGAIVEHDCRIGDHVHVSTGATLAGTVLVGSLSHIGAGATVRQGITIGDRAVVGAGAVVVKDVEAGTVVAGVPARVLRRTAEPDGSRN
jgi:sugar O-acyltransferase (sialic acid O-acetyltransferase NeuD family)